MPEDYGGEGHAQAPIIKRVKKVTGGHHGGAWKVAYADLVTAMMALFIVLWILAQSDEVIRSVAGYFRDPVGFTDGDPASRPPLNTEGSPPRLKPTGSRK